MTWLARARWRLALAICPAIDTALGKRALEEAARKCGASKTMAVGIASAYFNNVLRSRS